MKAVSSIIAALILGLGLSASAHDIHTDEVCSTQVADLCVHMGFHKAPVSTEASEFMVHFTSGSLDLAALDNVAVDLWMDMGHGHGHGTAPVKMQRLNADHFAVTEAWFVMAGPWQIRVNFEHDGVKDQIIVPIQVAK
ncbi:MAG: FixH family protein [Bdellovibrionaceae bacterium]|nr:FixH family protein [Pseudobdellovibrionaceae bacterium]